MRIGAALVLAVATASALPGLPAAAQAPGGGAYGALGAAAGPLMLQRPLALFSLRREPEPRPVAPALFDPQPMAGARARGLEPPARAYTGRGAAVWYAHKGRTASGQPFDPNALTAAHRSLPFGTKVRVTNRRNGRSVIVTINDRMGAGAKGAGVVIDLSRAAARAIGVEGRAEVVLHEAAPPPGDPVLASDR